jgi:uncharacterized membrane protein YcaP (DUF421 family)
MENVYMEKLFDPTSLSELFTPTAPLIESFLRGTVVYLALFTMVRFLVKKGAVASASMTDLLVLVLISNAVQNALIADYNSITDGIILVAVVIFWSYTLDWLSLRFKPLRRFAYPRPIKLIENGKPIWGNIVRELITEEQLYSLLRQQGIEDVSEVKEALVEPNGQVSVIPFDEQQDKGGASQMPDVT